MSKLISVTQIGSYCKFKFEYLLTRYMRGKNVKLRDPRLIKRYVCFGMKGRCRGLQCTTDGLQSRIAHFIIDCKTFIE